MIRVVGWCSTCGSPVLFSTWLQKASCACGDSAVPRRFLEVNARRSLAPPEEENHGGHAHP